MSKSVIFISLAAIALAVVLFFVLAPTEAGNEQKFERTFSTSEQELINSRVITAEELAEADGKDGRPAWVALDGVVYDLSALPSWVGGEHHGRYAGRDLTDQFLASGHGVAILQKLPVIGRFE